MKQTFYRFVYRIVSRLSDITGGASVFVRWKVTLAAIILGCTAVSLTNCRPHTGCYDQVAPPTCYDPVAPEEPCPETEEGEKARYDAGDPQFLEDADVEFRESPADSTTR